MSFPLTPCAFLQSIFSRCYHSPGISWIPHWSSGLPHPPHIPIPSPYFSQHVMSTHKQNGILHPTLHGLSSSGFPHSAYCPHVLGPQHRTHCWEPWGEFTCLQASKLARLGSPGQGQKALLYPCRQSGLHICRGPCSPWLTTFQEGKRYHICFEFIPEIRNTAFRNPQS